MSSQSTPLPDPQQLLPHGEGFRFVSSMLEANTRVSGKGVWRLSGDESFFADHFPGRPIVPGVLLIEALAQCSGLVAFDAQAPRQAGLAAANVRLTRPVTPPTDIILHSTFLHQTGPVLQFKVRAEVDGKTVAKGEITLVEAV